MAEATIQEDSPAAETTVAIAPREPRYHLRDPQVANVVLERADGASPTNVSAELRDISRSGAKLFVPICLPFEEVIVIRIEIPVLDLQLDVAATVRWVRPTDGAAWSVGCVFNHPLSDPVVGKLASGICMERRLSPRRDISLQATVHWELQLDDTSVTLQNLSTGGFCMHSPVAGEVGQRLLMHFETGDGTEPAVQAQIQWRSKHDNGYVVGCSFLNGQSYTSLRDAVTANESRQEKQPESQPTKNTIPSPLLGAMTLLALVLPSLILLPIEAQRNRRAVMRAEGTDRVDTGTLDDEQPVISMLQSDGTRSGPSSGAEFVQTVGGAKLGTGTLPSSEGSETRSAQARRSTRTWTDRTGKYSVVATLVEVKERVVRLRKANGRITSVPIERLSQIDQQFALNWAAAD